MLPFSFTIGGFIRPRGRCLLAARPQTPSDSSNHSTSPMGGGCLMPSAMSLGRDNRIARRYGSLLDPWGDRATSPSNHIHGTARVVISKVPALFARRHTASKSSGLETSRPAFAQGSTTPGTSWAAGRLPDRRRQTSACQIERNAVSDAFRSPCERQDEGGP